MKFLRLYGVLIMMLMTANFVLGQKGDRVEGYIVDNDDQKLEGYIELLGELNREVKVKFSDKKSAKKYDVVKIRDLKAYGFIDNAKKEIIDKEDTWRHFIKYEFERPAKVFATNESLIEVVVSEGYYSVYKFLYESGGNVDMPITTRYVVLNSNEEVAQVEEENFEEEALKLFDGYAALVTSIGKPKFRFRSFVRLIDDYNFWKENQHDASIYKLNPKIYN